jgi:hypothetical protein
MNDTVVRAKACGSEYAFSRGSTVVDISYEPETLTVHVEGTAPIERVIVEFQDVSGFRVLDERDLMEFWPTCSTPNGWLFEILAGGWLSQELARPGNLMGTLGTDLREYLVTGENECVSVITRNEPTIRTHAL